MEVLENRPDSVRIPACGAIGALRVAASENYLVGICENDSSSIPLRVAALTALGDINRGKGSVSPMVNAVLNTGIIDPDVGVMRAAARAIGVARLEQPAFSGQAAVKPAVMSGN